MKRQGGEGLQEKEIEERIFGRREEEKREGKGEEGRVNESVVYDTKFQIVK